MNAYYPNRKLGMEYAATRPEDAYHPNAMANVALSNLREGDIITIHRDQTLTVQKVTDNAIGFRGENGAVRYFAVDGKGWGATYPRRRRGYHRFRARRGHRRLGGGASPRSGVCSGPRWHPAPDGHPRTVNSVNRTNTVI